MQSELFTQQLNPNHNLYHLCVSFNFHTRKFILITYDTICLSQKNCFIYTLHGLLFSNTNIY